MLLALMVMPRSRSRSIESSTWAVISRWVSAPVSSSKRSARVDFPWSMCAMMQKLRTKRGSIRSDDSYAGWPRGAKLAHAGEDASVPQVQACGQSPNRTAMSRLDKLKRGKGCGEARRKGNAEALWGRRQNHGRTGGFAAGMHG